MQLWRDACARKKFLEHQIIRVKRRWCMHTQRAILACWHQELTLSQQRFSVVAAMRSSSSKLHPSSRLALREWRRVTAQQWTFRRSLLRTLRPLLAPRLGITLLQASWQGWINSVKYSKRISEQKCAVGTWVNGCAERQAAQATEATLSAVLGNWYAYARRQASRRRLQRAMVVRVQMSIVRKAMQAWHSYQAEEMKARSLECVRMRQVLSYFLRNAVPCVSCQGMDGYVEISASGGSGRSVPLPDPPEDPRTQLRHMPCPPALHR
jgi:hypothetical protein